MCEKKQSDVGQSEHLLASVCSPHMGNVWEPLMEKNTDSSELLPECKRVQESWVLLQEKERLRNRVIQVRGWGRRPFLDQEVILCVAGQTHSPLRWRQRGEKNAGGGRWGGSVSLNSCFYFNSIAGIHTAPNSARNLQAWARMETGRCQHFSHRPATRCASVSPIIQSS